MWNQRYDSETYLFGTDPAQFLVDQRLCFQPNQTALVIADGEGRNSTWLAQEGLQVTAMDAAENGLAKARALADQRGVSLTYQLADLRTWDWQADSFDRVVAVFIQFADPAFRKTIFEGMKHTVKPGGLILLHGFTPEQLQNTSGGPRLQENLYTTDMLANAFEDFEILRLQAYEAVLDEGPGHSGPAALIDLVARKPIEKAPGRV
ncbi:class I SAM-dependent methyltransferase [Pseudorhodobacter sp.]|uniref:SAM-dependent methyltransferase n=1 Tax=Pseudorhodobacter sp. TaxID=1934400 RepID=UPI002B002B82|nr:class I SAM-dependent methyltransferase [Pseudorhodobacter sp.]